MIKIFNRTQSLVSSLKHYQTIGFVPTMGNLHTGHLNLIKAAIDDQLQLIVISIYVNPTQFSDENDFNGYPRTLTSDTATIENLLRIETNNSQQNEVDIFIFAPINDEEVYPNGKQVIKASGPTEVFEGQLRPGHFDGMVTVVKRLFEITNATTAYFGKKDYQQCLIVHKLIEDFFPHINLKLIDTARDVNGLALSSRNSRLSNKQIQEALILRKSMLNIAHLIDSKVLLAKILEEIKEIVAKDKRFNYFALVNAMTLQPPKSLYEKLVLLGNFQIGEVRLLDNLEF